MDPHAATGGLFLWPPTAGCTRSSWHVALGGPPYDPERRRCNSIPTHCWGQAPRLSLPRAALEPPWNRWTRSFHRCIPPATDARTVLLDANVPGPGGPGQSTEPAVCIGLFGQSDGPAVILGSRGDCGSWATSHGLNELASQRPSSSPSRRSRSSAPLGFPPLA